MRCGAGVNKTSRHTLERAMSLKAGLLHLPLCLKGSNKGESIHSVAHWAPVGLGFCRSTSC